jgi:serine/threonine protein kinase
MLARVDETERREVPSRTIVEPSCDTITFVDTPIGAVGPRVHSGDRLGRFIILGQLGQGGMGVVLAAYDPSLDRRVAVKLLRPVRDGTGTASARSRLLREAQAMAQLSHPNVITVFETGELTVDGKQQVYLAMELVEGESLAKTLERLHEQTLSIRERTRQVVALFVQAGRGLAAAHAAGLVHRDFKPDNVLVGRDGRVRVMDFGLARQMLGDSSEAPVRLRETDTPMLAAITQAGNMVGTPPYMAPEQWQGHAVDPRTDQFSFCVALWEGIYGKRPFAGETLHELMEAIVAADPVAPPKVESWVPRRLRALVRRGLSSNPADRFPSMDALLAELDREPGGTECAMFDPMPLEVGEHAIDIPDVPSQFEGNCGGAGPDALFSFMAPADGTYEFTLTSVAFEGVLYLVGDECIPLDWIACVPEGEEPLVHQMVQGEVVYIIVDSTADPGPATLTIAAI